MPAAPANRSRRRGRPSRPTREASTATRLMTREAWEGLTNGAPQRQGTAPRAGWRRCSTRRRRRQVLSESLSARPNRCGSCKIRAKKTPPERGFRNKPTAGLEPATPSLRVDPGASEPSSQFLEDCDFLGYWGHEGTGDDL